MTAAFERAGYFLFLENEARTLRRAAFFFLRRRARAGIPMHFFFLMKMQNDIGM